MENILAPSTLVASREPPFEGDEVRRLTYACQTESYARSVRRIHGSAAQTTGTWTDASKFSFSANVFNLTAPARNCAPPIPREIYRPDYSSCSASPLKQCHPPRDRVPEVTTKGLEPTVASLKFRTKLQSYQLFPSGH